MNTLCNEWEACMNKDPESLMRVRIGVKNIIDLINEIVESMTWKTIVSVSTPFASALLKISNFEHRVY